MVNHGYELERLLAMERIERRVWDDLLALMPAELVTALGVQTAVIHGARLLLATQVPQFQFNWLQGTGLNGDDGSSIPVAVGHFRSTGQRKFIVQIPPGPNGERCSHQAAALGLAPHSLAWAKFFRSSADPPPNRTDLRVEEATPADGFRFARCCTAGFGMPEIMTGWLELLVGRPGWHCYITLDGDEPAGAGALFVDGEYAWLGLGSTRPQFRKRGSQGALFRRRIADAAVHGARHVTTETGVPQPGQPAPSYANILRAGFEVAYVRPNWSEKV